MRYTIITIPMLIGIASALLGCADDAGHTPNTQSPTGNGGSDWLSAEGTALGLDLSCTPHRLDVDECLDADLLQSAAAKSCGNGELGSISYEARCSSDGWRAATYDCCGDQGEAEDPIVLGPGCRQVTASSGGACVSEEELLSAARLQCGTGAMGAFTWSDSCKGGAVALRAMCCDSEPPPAAKEVLPCLPIEVAEPNICLDPRALEARARGVCEANGRTLTQVHMLGDCGGGTFFRAQASCCERLAPVMNDEVAVGSCTTNTLGSSEECQAPSTLATIASARCAAQGLALSQIETFGSCGAGNSRFARFSCCTSFRAEEQCVVQQLGGAYCAPQGVWALAAQSSCAAVGRRAAGVAAITSCGTDVFAGAEVSCCGAETFGAEPPAADQCFSTTLLNAQCTASQSWRGQADAFCALRGAATSQVSLGVSCGADASGSATIECCTAPTGPEACVVREAAVPGKCLEESEAQGVADTLCAAEQRRASAVKVGCDATATRLVATCCE